jgi:hypothetical protein
LQEGIEQLIGHLRIGILADGGSILNTYHIRSF